MGGSRGTKIAPLAKLIQRSVFPPSCKDLVSNTKVQLLKMLKFLDSTDMHDRRLECAIQLALDPSVRRRKRVSAEDVFRNRTALACQVWQSFTDNPHSRLLLNTLGYDNY